MKRTLSVLHTFAAGTTASQSLTKARRQQLEAIYVEYQLHGDLGRYFSRIEQMMDGWDSMLRKAAAKPGSLARRASVAPPAWLTMVFTAAYTAHKAEGYKRVGWMWLAGEARRQIENNKDAYPDWEACRKAVTRRHAERFLATRKNK